MSPASGKHPQHHFTTMKTKISNQPLKPRSHPQKETTTCKPFLIYKTLYHLQSLLPKPHQANQIYLHQPNNHTYQTSFLGPPVFNNPSKPTKNL